MIHIWHSSIVPDRSIVSMIESVSLLGCYIIILLLCAEFVSAGFSGPPIGNHMAHGPRVSRRIGRTPDSGMHRVVGCLTSYASGWYHLPSGQPVKGTCSVETASHHFAFPVATLLAIPPTA